MSKESLATTIRQWERLIAASESNAAELDYLVEEREKLRAMVERVKQLKSKQLELTAAKQQVSRDLDAAKEGGREIAVRMRYGIKTRYGYKGEKLVQFGLKPRRAYRKKPRKGETPEAGE